MLNFMKTTIPNTITSGGKMVHEYARERNH